MVTVAKIFYSLLNISCVTSHRPDKLKDTVKDNYLNQIHLVGIHNKPDYNRKNSRLLTETIFSPIITAKMIRVLSYWVELLWQALKQNVTNINQPTSIIAVTVKLLIHWANPVFLCTDFNQHHSTTSFKGRKNSKSKASITHVNIGTSTIVLLFFSYSSH